MADRIHHLSAWLVACLGVVHSTVTAFVFDGWSPGTAWFLGTGLGLALLGALNLSVRRIARPLPPALARLCERANILAAVFGVAVVVAVPEPQGFVVLLGLVGMAVTTPIVVRQ